MNLQSRFKLTALASLFLLNSIQTTQCNWWKFSEENYHIPVITTGLITLLTTNWLMGKSVDNRVKHEIYSKNTELESNSKLLEAASKIVKPTTDYPEWESNLVECYHNLDFSRENNRLTTLEKIDIPQEIYQPKVAIGNPGTIFGNLSNFFSDEITIHSSHPYAKSTQTLKKNIEEYNTLWNGRKKTILRYSALFNLHTGFLNNYLLHKKSIAGFAKTSNARKIESDYSELYQQTPVTSAPILDADVETQLVAECETAGTHPYYNAGVQLDQKIRNIENALNPQGESHLNCSRQAENTVTKKINEGLNHLKKMNVLFKRTINYAGDLEIYNKERDTQNTYRIQQEQLNLEKERLKTERMKARAEIIEATARARELEAKRQKEKEEARYTQTQNRALREEKGMCPIQ